MVSDCPCVARLLNLGYSSSRLLHLVGHRVQQVWSQESRLGLWPVRSLFNSLKLQTKTDTLPHSETKQWAEAYLPYIIFFSCGYLCQLSLYWILGTFSTDVKSSARTGGLFRAFEVLGQTVSYAINSNKAADPRNAFYVNCALLALTIPCMVALIRMVPDVPASHDIDVEGPRSGEAVTEMEDKGQTARAG
jgi:hypothetical protein